MFDEYGTYLGHTATGLNIFIEALLARFVIERHYPRVRVPVPVPALVLVLPEVGPEESGSRGSAHFLRVLRRVVKNISLEISWIFVCFHTQ